MRRCIGNPPRQTEDPQSPPCLPFWEGDNGGATTKGVTGGEIRVIQTGGGRPTGPVLERYFNSRFEFYEREVRIIRLEEGEEGDNTCTSQKAAAVTVDEKYQAFAVIDPANGDRACFHEELARRGVISTTNLPFFSERELAAMHPYLWQYTMAYDRGFAGIAQMVCARLAGGEATHAGDPLYQQSPRRFGIIYHELERDPHGGSGTRGRASGLRRASRATGA